MTISGSTAGNDGVYTVTGFVDPFDRPNNGVLLSSPQRGKPRNLGFPFVSVPIYDGTIEKLVSTPSIEKTTFKNLLVRFNRTYSDG